MYKVWFWKNSTGEKPIAKWLKTLTADDRRYLGALFRDLATDGPDCKPKSFKHLDGALWEIRDTRKNGPGYRVYFGLNGSTMVCLVVSSGNKKSQKRDIELAKSRLKGE